MKFVDLADITITTITINVETSKASLTRHSTPVYHEVNELGINRIERVFTEKFVCDLTESSALG